MAARRDDAVSEALDRLFAAPLDAFIALRRELGASLRVKGDPEAMRASREVATAPKPTRTAWALNQVARNQPELVRAMLEARDGAAARQKRGEGEAIRVAVREYRARMTEVTHAARDVLAAAGFGVTASQLRRMGETLATASVEGSDARAQLTAGRLTEDVGLDDPFAGVEAGPGRAPMSHPEAASPPEGARATAAATSAKAQAAAESEKARAAARAKAKHEAARKAAQERVEALEIEARDARAEARQRETAALRATHEADRARRALEEVESRLGAAREALRAMGT
jgi:hypothetical protein